MGADQLHPVVLHHVVNTLDWPALRPLQEEAVAPLLAGDDALLLAPTAGGKTEAAAFPLISAMAEQQWRGLSVLYVCPLRALLNNLEPRLAGYTGWVGRRTGLWHGDTAASRRARLREDPPDLLLTTPESLESMLVSTSTDPTRLFADLRAIVVDEVHAFAGDDRGWHLLAVLERLQHHAGRPLQRIGLSATVGNPDGLLMWLQGSGKGNRPARVVAPEVGASSVLPPPGDVTLDHVRTLDNAGKVIAALHAGEKRLVFCESRRAVEDLALSLRAYGVQTFVSHSSLSIDERRRAEAAFADARDCVIVSTSTLELGIDVGDLDRVIQIDAPSTVASFLQRIGRTGRRAGSARNALFLTTSGDRLLQAAGVLNLWAQGFVEPVTPPPHPRHIVAQQLVALCLERGRIGANQWAEVWAGSGLHDERAEEIAQHLIESGHLEQDQGMYFVGPETERRYGRKNFLELMSVFMANPEFRVLQGRADIGSVDPIVLTRKIEGPRVVVLAGRSWKVTYIDWKRKRCYVEPTDAKARMRWIGGSAPLSYELTQSMRAVLLGADPAVTLSKRAVAGLGELREDRSDQVWDGGLVVDRSAADVWWHTWAGSRANATLAAALDGIVDPHLSYDDTRVRLRNDLRVEDVRTAVQSLDWTSSPRPALNPDAVSGLKFGEVLPPGLAHDTVAERLLDTSGAQRVAGERMTFRG